MSVLAQCPICKRKQKTKNKKCVGCGEDLTLQKKSQKVKYWITNRIRGSQRTTYIGVSLQEAQDADGKRRSQKRENPFFDIKEDAKLTFQQLTDWYLNLERVKNMKYYQALGFCLKRFNSEFGDMIINQIKPTDLENLQEKRKSQNMALSTIDQEIGAAKTMIQKAIDDDKISGDAIRPFRKVKKLLKSNANARDRVITIDEFYALLENAPTYLKPVISLGFFGGMREGEILNLTKNKLYLHDPVPHIALTASDTKDAEPRVIPLACKAKGNPYDLLKNIPSAIHNDRIFLYRGKPFNDIRGGFRRACQKSGLLYGRFKKGGFVFHDLRHCFSTYMRRAGVDQSTIMKITGHSEYRQEMWFRYNTWDLHDLKTAIKKLEAYLENVDQNVDQREIK